MTASLLLHHIFPPYFPNIFHPLTGNGYQLWSGIMGATAIFGGMYMLYRKHNCHQPWCWRMGKFNVEGTPYVTCHRHHPGLEGKKVAKHHIHLAHHRNQERAE